MDNYKNPPQSVVNKIIDLFNKSQLEQTVLLAENVSEQYPRASILYEILGAAYLGLNNVSKTIDNYNRVLLLNPNSADAHNQMLHQAIKN